MDTHKKLLDGLASEIVWCYHEFNEFKKIYYHSQSRTELLNFSAKAFFSELFYIYVDRIILGASRLTDPAKNYHLDKSKTIKIDISNCNKKKKKRSNNRVLSILHIHESLSGTDKYPFFAADIICKQMLVELDEVRILRNKVVAHNDLRLSLSDEMITTLFYPHKVEAFFELCQKYLSLVYGAMFEQPYPISTVGDVEVLISKLKYAKVADHLFDTDIERFDSIYASLDLDEA